VPGHALLCVDTHKDRPSITTVCCACGAGEKLSKTLYIKDATSSLVLNAVSKAHGVTGEDKINVRIRRLDSVLKEHSITRMDVLVVDVEGFEIEVLNGFSIAKCPPKLAIIETHELSGAPFLDNEGINRTSVFCDTYFRDAGYSKIFADAGNTFYVRNEQ